MYVFISFKVEINRIAGSNARTQPLRVKTGFKLNKK